MASERVKQQILERLRYTLRMCSKAAGAESASSWRNVDVVRGELSTYLDARNELVTTSDNEPYPA